MSDTNQAVELAELKALAAVYRAEIELKQQQLKTLTDRIAALEWQPIEWDALEQLLKTEYSGCDYRKCPTVSQRGGLNQTHCSINDKGELVVGPYFHNDRFPRGCSLFIHHARKTWG